MRRQTSDRLLSLRLLAQCRHPPQLLECYTAPNDHAFIPSTSSLVSASAITGPGLITPLLRSSGKVPKARSPNNKSTSSSETWVVSLKRKNMVGKVITMLNAVHISVSTHLYIS